MSEDERRKNQKEICYGIRTMGTEALGRLKKRDGPQAPNEERGKCATEETPEELPIGTMTKHPIRVDFHIHCPRRSHSPTRHAIVRDVPPSALPCAGAAENTSSATSV